MRTAKRITTACLTAIMLFQALAPSTEVFAQELDAVMEVSVSAARAAGNTARSVQDAVATALEDADQATSDDAATTPGADAGATEGGNGSTNAGESQDSTTDGTTSGDASTGGDASQGGATADDSAADEEQADDADADAAAQADVSYEYNTVKELKDAIGDANVTVDADKVIGVTIGTSEDLIKLSNTDPAIYQNAAITKGGATGSGLNLCSAVTVADGVALSFLGLGAPNAPFKGSFGSGISPIVLNRPLFNNVELSADMTLTLTWEGATSDPIVATAIAGGGHKLTVGLTIAPAADNTTAVTLTSPLLASVSGALTLDAAYAAKGNATPAVNIQSKTDNVGLLANALADGATLSIEKLTLPSVYSGNPTIQTTKDGASAGGLIGVCGNGAIVAINGNVGLSSFSVIGKAASGGLIGKATNLTLGIANGTTVKPARVVGDATSDYSGGVIGDVSFKDGFTVKPNMFDLGDLVALDATQRAGALFGVADISNGDIVVQGGTYKSKLASKRDGDTGGSYGGLVGKVFATTTGGDGALRALVVQKDADNNCTIEFELASKLSDAGGVVGYVGDSTDSTQPVAVVLNGVKVACKGDTVSARTSTGKFGGAVGVVDTHSVLDVRDFTLTSSATIGGKEQNRAAGIAGSAWNAVIKFSGITDLSGASFAENGTTGQLVYENNNALIFAAGDGSNGELTDKGATGWTFKRSNTASKTDDIATYGEVIRLGRGLSESFIALDSNTHVLTLPTSLESSNSAYALTSVEDFAKLAITWQTNGYYPMVTGVSDNNLNGLQSSTITVSGKIDLAGTGLTGLTQDRADSSQVFSGTLSGSGTINLAVGEPYGVRDKNEERDGNGKIYRHGRLGLFAAVNGATVSNVTIAGSIKFDNQSNVDAGALAGVKVGGDTSLTSASFSAEIRYESTKRDNYVRVGSVFGSMSGAGSLEIGSRESSSVVNAKIVSNAQERGATCVGGAIGYVAGDCIPSAAGKTVEVDGLTISGSIAINSGSVKTYAGGFIGQIAQGGFDGSSGVKRVEITKLDFKNFGLVTASSNASNSAGLLGYSWAGAEVTFGDDSVNKNDSSYAISTAGSSVSSTKSTEFGGLVYAASGHWVINDYALNLSGVTLSAPNAEKFGMLVCRTGSGVSSAGESLAGLYLENRAPWATAYKVNTDKNAITTQAKTFDEWVADGCKPGSAVDDCGVNGVVSLHTKEEKLHMTDDDGARNSYVNRTFYGSQPEHQANGSVRYYYNLDRAVAHVKQSGIATDKKEFITTPEQLLVWSVSWYAPKALRPYVWREADSPLLCYGIGRIGAFSGNKTFDMTGYSYYPIDITNINAYVYFSTIKFCFSEINKKEDGNKQNSRPSQHMNMHAGLFSSYSGLNGVTVRSVTLQGSIGSASGGTGALFTKYVKGDSKGVAKVEIKDLILDGIKVDGAKDAAYAPLLINQLSSKTSLTVKGGYKNDYRPADGKVQGITVKTGSYKAGEKAATSLFGNLGDEKAEMVTANFQDITVPSSKADGIFTHASLLESFAYDGTKSGSSASYIFYSDKHIKEDPSFTYFEPTYGAEIDTKGNDSEYEGQQRWYNDKKGYMTDDNLVTDGSIRANEDSPQFASKYLPYVYKSKEGTGEHAHDTYHEIKVNQRVSNLLTGCGTYGDPYTLTNAAEVVTVANYINGKESAADGWQITVIDDQENLCTRRNPDAGSTEHELIYEYKRSQGSWVCTTDSSKTLSNDTMHGYIQSAYYSIEPANSKTETLDYIELDGNSFKGFGNKDNPFRGVIVGNLKKGLGKATLKIVKKTRTFSGLIPYSYGCVVKNLNVEYSGGGSVTSNTISYVESTDGIPASFFGGIFGCILGGDNIIDGVAVSSNGFTVAGVGDKSHLVPVGGYVGAIAGGGVIFRNMAENENSSWRAGTSDKSRGLGKGDFDLYDNPYVGRVIDGYAFSEGCAVDNGDANYKINELVTTNTGCITTGDIKGRYRNKGNNKAAVTTTVNNVQGLLVLSAIISSGAAGGSANASTSAGSYGTPAGSRAYLGGNNADGTYQFGNQQYGKVRNASYESVGKPESTNGDFVTAINDDMKSPGIQTKGDALDYAGNGSDVNSPYLVRKYATWQTGYICAVQVSGMDLQFATNTTPDYDMTTYGSGFTGLSGRYYSNACASASGADRDRIVPLVACINGNGAKIKVGSKDKNKVYGVTEYKDDDYKVAGVGALFSTVSFTSKNVSDNTADAMVKDLKFVDCDVELTIKDANGTGQAGDNVGVGLLAGVTANNDGGVNDGGVFGIYRRVTMNGCKVAGAKNVGGLLGSSGYCSRAKATTSTSEIIEKARMASPVKLYDCSYTNMDVRGGLNVGGYVGAMDEGTKCGIWTTTPKNATIASSSTVAGTSPGAHIGGAFGWTKDSVSVAAAMDSRELETTNLVKVSNVTIKADFTNAGSYMGAGGLIGRADYGIISISNLSVTSDQGCYIGNVSTNRGNLCNAGGVIGFVNSRPYCKYWFNNCTVKGLRLSMNSVVGGVLGYFWSTQGVVYDNIKVEDLVFDGQYSGGLTGRYLNSVDVSASNIKVASSTFQQAFSGGVSGEGKGKFHLANVLLDSNTFNSKDQQGILFGNVDTSNLGGYELYAAGISVKLAEGQTNATMPALIRASDSSKIGEVNMKSYVAFGGYKASPAAPSDGETLYGADTAGNTTPAVYPHVTTSPVSSLSVKTASGDAGQTRYLFGDGVNVSGDGINVFGAADIMGEAGKTITNRYTYTNIGGIDDKGAYRNTSNYSASSAGEFNANNDTDVTKTDANPNVLVLSGNDSDTVKDYLNIVTNGGYSDALRLNADGSHVSATVDVFKLEDGVFVKQSNVTDKALDVKGSGSSLSISANTNWDNGKGRFNLLTVTFTEAGQSYRVMVPIIVKRVFEINFTATYSEGSNFNSDDYSSKYDKHVLISGGETMTGYLTWTYNKAYKQPTEYGWNTHLASGGDMRPLNKRIVFGGERGALPAGTQLTLVDTAHNSKEYHYTVPEGGSCTSVALTDFEDSSRSHYTEQWLSETMGAAASVPEDGSGSWVKLTDEELTDEKNAKKTEAELIRIAGAKIGDDYYRVKTDADTKGPFYKLTVPNEQSKSESFYLVVRTPKNSANVNGYTGTSVMTSVNTHLNYTLRNKDVTKDSHENTASTYSVATNFQHNLVDHESGTNQMTVHGTTYSLYMNVSDTITFGEQEYTSSDTLYYQLDSSLVNYEGGKAAGAHGYPTGTQGTYSFYVMVENNYYTWDGSKWKDAGTKKTPAVDARDWSSKTGGDMSLVLADANGAIDLSGIREIAKSHKSEFVITMKASLTMTEPACQAGIIASQKGDGDKYTKPNYRAYLSTNSGTLSTSSNSAYNDGGAGYFRMDVGSSTIALEASKKSQLGINIDDLKSADGEIALVGTYDFSKLNGADAMISNATTVTYTLSLQKRQDNDDGSYRYVPVNDDISKYITEYIAVLGDDKHVELVEGTLSDDHSSYVFTDNKTGDKFATRYENSLAFKHSFRVKVNTNVEGKGQTYANYRLVLTAHMFGGDVNDTPVNANNLDGYANSDYVTYTLARINTEGIQHGSTTN